MTWLAQSTRSEKVVGSIPNLGLSVWSLHLLLWLPPTGQKCMRGSLETLNGRVSEGKCLFVLLCPAMNWQLVLCVTLTAGRNIKKYFFKKCLF